ncbi:hypothetical protein STEG23_010661, partial [Scotinomys teguina]
MQVAAEALELLPLPPEYWDYRDLKTESWTPTADVVWLEHKPALATPTVTCTLMLK